MNRTAFQIYGSKKTGIFQSTWDTTLVSALGSEQAAITATGTNWALNTGATNLNVGGYKHTAGSTTNLTTTLSATIMQMYQITYTISDRTAGSVTINYGGVSTSGITASSSVNILATATTVFSITPTSDFDGVISISIKQTSSATNQIKLPLPNIGTYNIWVDWGDGTYNNITSYNSVNTLHTYPAPGIYTVRITGDRFNFGFGLQTNDRLKIKTIYSWGKLKLNTYCFFGCSNLTMSGITDVPDLTGVTSFQYLFGGCSKITTIGRSNEWNTSSVTYTGNMFDSCTLFNSNISNWNVSNVTSFSAMFSACTNFNNGFVSGITNQLTWTINTTSSVSMASMFANCTSFNSNLGTGTTPWDVSKVTSFANMFQGASNFNNGDDTAPINNWSINTVSNVNMSAMFASTSVFNRPIDNWNMTKVNNTASMFSGATSFNQSLSNWERVGSTLSNVIDMSSMFYNATIFNGNLSGWNLSKVITFTGMFQQALAFNNGAIAGAGGTMPWTINTTTSVIMNFMFYNHYSFNQDIGSWNVSKVTSFNSFLYHDNGSQANTFNNGYSDSIKNWNVGSCTDFSFMFVRCRFNQPVHLWDVSKATFMNGMFYGCPSFNNGYASGVVNQLPWNTSACTNMSQMFLSCTSFNSNLGTGTTPWDVSKVISFASMFQGASNFNNGDDTAPINNWSINTVSSVSMASMFNGASVFNRYISDWNLIKVTTTNGMFNNAIVFNNGYASGNTGTLPWNTSSVTDMGNMFNYSPVFNQDISTWNVSNVASFDQAFRGTTLFNNGGSSNINNWVFKSTGTINCNAMFWGANSFNQPVNNWNLSKVTSTRYMFLSCSVFNQSINGWDLSSVTNVELMFSGCNNFNNGYASGIGNTLTLTLNTTTPVTSGSIFANCPSFNCDINTLDFSQFTTMNSILSGATKFNNGLASGVAGVLNINTSNVVDMSSMFYNCTSFNQDVGLFNVSKVTNFTNMFYNTTVFNNGADANPIDNWTLNTTVGANINMTQMFGKNVGINIFNRALNSWNTTEVTNMSGMFTNGSGGANAFNQPLNNWNTTKVTNMSAMFLGCNIFNQDISAWNVTNVTNMNNMFQSATAFQQNIGNWDIRNVTNFTSFMSGKTPTTFPATYLDNIYNGWSTRAVKPSISISFGTAKYSQAGKAGKDTLLGSPNNWTITDGLLTVSGTSNNVGLIRVTTSAAHGFTTGNIVYIYGVNGTTNANGTWTVTVISTTVIELQGSTYNAAWTGGGNVILG